MTKKKGRNHTITAPALLLKFVYMGLAAHTPPLFETESI
jgi:hypothetical protein